MRTFLVLIAIVVVIDALAFGGRVRYATTDFIQIEGAAVSHAVQSWIDKTFNL